MNRLIRMIGLIGVVSLTACMAEDGSPDKKDDTVNIGDTPTVCDLISGSTYVSNGLEEGGRTATGVAKMHWRVDLKDGVVTTMQSDFRMAGTYECSAGEVTATLTDSFTTKLKFSKDLSSLVFSPFSGAEPMTYVRHLGKSGNTDCAKVDGLSFAPSSEKSSGEVAALRAAKLDIQVSFSGDQLALLTENGRQVEGVYDCDLDKLHIHRNNSDANPIEAVFDERQGTLTVAAYGQTQVLSKVEDRVFCTQQYDPVCAVVPQNVQCLVAPCPAGSYKTFGNDCEAGAAGAKASFSSECGELEGQPVFDDKPTACTKEYAPVCAAVTKREPCLTMPCPNQAHKTFGNRCMADADLAVFVKSGECGKLEGSPLLSKPNVQCIALFDPVCAKDEAGIVCVKEPCPTHVYKTQSNHRTAAANVAEVVYKGECGLLEGAQAEGQPPAIIVSTDDMPKTQQKAVAGSVFFDGDLVTMKLKYTGCGSKHFDLYIDNAFMESFPVQVKAVFVPQLEEFCKANMSSEFTFDLAPLRSAYQSAYQVETGSVIIQGVGLFEF